MDGRYDKATRPDCAVASILSPPVAPLAMNVGYRSLVSEDVASVKVTLVAVVAVPLNEPVNVVAVTDDRPASVVVVEPRVILVDPRVNPLLTNMAFVTTPAPIVVDRATFPVPSNVIPEAVTFPVSENVLAVCNAVAVDALPDNAPVNVVAAMLDIPLMLVVVEPRVMLVEPRVKPLFTSIALVTVDDGMTVVSVMPAVPSNATPVAVTLPVRAMLRAVAS